MFDTIFFFLCNRLDDDINSIENTLCADDIQTFLLLVELFARGSSRCEYRGWRESIDEFTKIDKSAVKDAFVASSYLANCYWYGVGVPQSFHQAEFWKQYSLNLLYTYRDFYEDPIDCEGFISGVLDEIGRLSVSCHIQRNLPDALYTDEQWGCISDFGCMPTELVAMSRAEKPDTPYISHTSSLVMQMIQKTSLEELKQMVEQGNYSQLIRQIPVHKGDFFQINPGCVHAIKGGTLILETQQSSDITYRVYDYDRLQNGKPRQLHVEQSIDVIEAPFKTADIDTFTEEIPGAVHTHFVTCKFYSVDKYDIDGVFTLDAKKYYTNVSVIAGEGTVNGIPVKKGTHFIIPANFNGCRFEGKLSVICSNPEA